MYTPFCKLDDMVFTFLLIWLNGDVVHPIGYTYGTGELLLVHYLAARATVPISFNLSLLCSSLSRNTCPISGREQSKRFWGWKLSDSVYLSISRNMLCIVGVGGCWTIMLLGGIVYKISSALKATETAANRGMWMSDGTFAGDAISRKSFHFLSQETCLLVVGFFFFF